MTRPAKSPGGLLQLLLAVASCGQKQPTDVYSAMMAGLTDTLWSIEDLYDAMMKHEAHKKHRARIDKLLAKLRSLD